MLCLILKRVLVAQHIHEPKIATRWMHLHTVGSVITTNQSVPDCVQSYSQSQARLMFVTTLGMDNFDCTKMNAHFKKFTACLREGLIHEWKQALLAPIIHRSRRLFLASHVLL